MSKPISEMTGDSFKEPELAEDEFEKKFIASILDQSKEYAPPEPVVVVHHRAASVPLLTLKSYSLWQGKQKSKKTTALAIISAAYIRETVIKEEIYFERAAPGKILFFDTEQGQSYAARTMRLTLKLAGLESSPNLIYCDLRETAAGERLKIISAGIRLNPEVKLVVIDGIVDLMIDFMDPQQGHTLISSVIALCSKYDIHIAGVLHQNKNDKNARAHVGTISSQKCEIEVSTEIDPQDRTQSIVSCVNSRGLPFEAFAIRWEKGSLPYINQDWTPEGVKAGKTLKKVDEARSVAETVFKPLAALTYTEAINGIMAHTYKSESTAKRYLTDLKGWGMVKNGPDGLYRIVLAA